MDADDVADRAHAEIALAFDTVYAVRQARSADGRLWVGASISIDAAMHAYAHQRYRSETRRLVARRGPFGAGLFAVGVGCAGLLEYLYHPERLYYLVVFFGLELAICVIISACYRTRWGRRLGATLTQVACIGLLICMMSYGAVAGLNRAALALLIIVFELTVALVFPWGVVGQAVMATACMLAYGILIASGSVGPDPTLPIAYELYAVAAGGVLSVLGAAFLDRQRFTVFVQREQLDHHLATFQSLTRTFRGLEPGRVVFLTCLSTLRTFRLRRVWIAWRAPESEEVHGYLVRADGEGMTWQPLADARPLYTWSTQWEDGGQAFLTRGTAPNAPTLLAAAGIDRVLCIPLASPTERLGVLCADRDGLAFSLDERELALASVMASGATIALANAWLYQKGIAASEEKSVFLARIAHELRNPLQAILWDVDTLREEAPASALRLERLRQDALMTLDLAKQLQDFAEIETHRLTVTLEPVSLEQTLDNLRATAMSALEGRPIRFAVNVAPDAQSLVTDPFRLRQVLGNLISNAAKFTARGAIEIDARRSGAEVVVSVRDSGSGIAKPDLARIFTPFFRGSTGMPGGPRGMGLGLAIAQETAALLGGRIEVASAIGRGSTFRLFLPAGATPTLVAAPPAPTFVAAPAAPAPARHGPARARSGATVLLIEDDPDYRAKSAAALRRRGATVVQARDGFEGLRQARQRRPDLVVLDLGLPGMSGLEVLAQLKRDPKLAEVPVVVTTADAELEARCRAAGCAAFLTKPYAVEDVLLVLATRRSAQARAEAPGHIRNTP